MVAMFHFTLTPDPADLKYWTEMATDRMFLSWLFFMMVSWFVSKEGFFFQVDPLLFTPNAFLSFFLYRLYH